MTNSKHIIIVSGSPRSGTSLMMQILDAGGILLFYDDTKPPDQSNPYGYFEKHEMFLYSTDQSGENIFLSLCKNKGVKILPPTVLPTVVNSLKNEDCLIKIIFMLRDEIEVANSYITMVEEAGKLNVPSSPFYGKSREEAMNKFIQMRRENIQMTLNFLNSQENNADFLVVNHNELVFSNTAQTLSNLSNFIRSDLPQYEMNIQAMTEVIDLDLYRQRQSQQN